MGYLMKFDFWLGIKPAWGPPPAEIAAGIMAGIVQIKGLALIGM
jgi:hypothetical protein